MPSLQPGSVRLRRLMRLMRGLDGSGVDSVCHLDHRWNDSHRGRTVMTDWFDKLTIAVGITAVIIFVVVVL